MISAAASTSALSCQTETTGCTSRVNNSRNLVDSVEEILIGLFCVFLHLCWIIAIPSNTITKRNWMSL